MLRPGYGFIRIGSIMHLLITRVVFRATSLASVCNDDFANCIEMFELGNRSFTMQLDDDGVDPSQRYETIEAEYQVL